MNCPRKKLYPHLPRSSSESSEATLVALAQRLPSWAQVLRVGKVVLFGRAAGVNHGYLVVNYPRSSFRWVSSP